MVASSASLSATADSRPSRRDGDGGSADDKAFVLFEGQRLRSRRKAKAKLVASSSVVVDSGGVEEETDESFINGGSSDDGQPGGNDDDGRGDDESQLLVDVAAANYTKPYSAKSVKKSKTSKPSSVPSSQPSVSDVPSVSTDPSSQPSMNPSFSGIPSSQVSEVWILLYYYDAVQIEDVFVGALCH